MPNLNSLTVKETAGHLRLTTQAVYNLIKRNELPAFKVGSAVRILERDLEDYIMTRKNQFAERQRGYQAPPEDFFAVRNLSAHFETKSQYFSISDINFEIPVGSTLGILGPSGSGKTLLLKAIAGLVRPDSGAVFLGSKRLDQQPVHQRRIGLVFQDYALYPVMNSRDNIGFPLRVAKVKPDSIDPAVLKIAHELGIDETYLPKKINCLPEGIKQLIAIGRAESKPSETPPELFLMDEPLIHLDARLHEETRAFLKRLVGHFKTTTIYTFNNMTDAMALSDRLLIIRDGKIVQAGLAEAVYENPTDKLAMELLSAHGISTVPGNIESGQFNSPYIWTTVTKKVSSQVNDNYHGPAELCFRPENLQVFSPSRKRAVFFRATIEKVVPYDGNRNIAKLLLLPTPEQADDSVPLKSLAIIPQSAEGQIAFSPTKAIIFPAAQSDPRTLVV